MTVREGVALSVSRARLADVAVAALEAAGAPRPASIGLILSDDTELAELDAMHMGVEGPTDVLSFPLLPPAAFPDHPRGAPFDRSPGPTFVLPPTGRPHLGDLVISVERAAAQARGGRGGQTGDVRWSTSEELRLLVAHGTLHVCGWDHAEPVEEAAMRELEQRLLGATSPRVSRS